MVNALTVDVEDYFHVAAFESQVSRSAWDDYPSRVVANTHRLLRLFDRRQVRATFFVLGWVGHRFPGLVRDIARAGHEVGCHSYWHRLIYRQTPEEFAADLKQSCDVLQDTLGEPVLAYRAPTFSITRQSLWALPILAEAGLRYDSSIFPVYHDRYGIPDADRFPHRIRCGGNELWEFPPTVFRMGPFNLPVCGGGYFRLYPVHWSASFLRQSNRLGQPFLFYIHPWEVDPNQPRLPAPRRTSWRHYLNLATTERKLDWLLHHFRFGSMSEALGGKSEIRNPKSETNSKPEIPTT